MSIQKETVSDCDATKVQSLRDQLVTVIHDEDATHIPLDVVAYFSLSDGSAQKAMHPALPFVPGSAPQSEPLEFPARSLAPAQQGLARAQFVQRCAVEHAPVDPP